MGVPSDPSDTAGAPQAAATYVWPMEGSSDPGAPGTAAPPADGPGGPGFASVQSAQYDARFAEAIGTAHFTFAGWVRFTAGTSRHVVLQRSLSPRRGIQVNIQPRTSDGRPVGRVRFRVDGTVRFNQATQPPPYLQPDTWYHVAASRDASVRLYINGVEVSSQGDSAGDLSPASGTPLYLGAAGTTMKDWAYWPRALAAAEVLELFQAGDTFLANPTADLPQALKLNAATLAAMPSSNPISALRARGGPPAAYTAGYQPVFRLVDPAQREQSLLDGTTLG